MPPRAARVMQELLVALEPEADVGDRDAGGGATCLPESTECRGAQFRPAPGTRDPREHAQTPVDRARSAGKRRRIECARIRLTAGDDDAAHVVKESKLCSHCAAVRVSVDEQCGDSGACGLVGERHGDARAAGCTRRPPHRDEAPDRGWVDRCGGCGTHVGVLPGGGAWILDCTRQCCDGEIKVIAGQRHHRDIEGAELARADVISVEGHADHAHLRRSETRHGVSCQARQSCAHEGRSRVAARGSTQEIHRVDAAPHDGDRRTWAGQARDEFRLLG